MQGIRRQRIRSIAALPDVFGKLGERTPQQPAYSRVVFDNQNCHFALLKDAVIARAMPDAWRDRREALSDEPPCVMGESYFTVKLTRVLCVMFPSLPVNVRVKVP